MTRQELANILSGIRDFEHGKDLVYDLEVYENRRERTIDVYIIKYNLETFLTELNRVVSNVNTATDSYFSFMEDRKLSELIIKKQVSIFWVCVKSVDYMFRQEDLIMTDVFMRFINQLDRHAQPTFAFNKLKQSNEPEP